MVAYLGNPPTELLQRSERAPLVFDEAGHWKGNPPLPQLLFEASGEHLEGANKAAFLNFMRSMLTWLPEERKTAKELLEILGCVGVYEAVDSGTWLFFWHVNHIRTPLRCCK
ncbi:hypothetical protein H2199_000225 [Coniosporium tulheliwenetii]|uniref:Uncharacterized protein n=1 Tax=Coniosporium tulheliwenetii TaxID=3383036 RepID=A0ACC2ZPE6_9PEZI|nr:hypothetical protein H2199_000225 [Cladosporium sp. JES 115]